MSGDASAQFSQAADRYAAAVFELAVEAKALDAVEKDFVTLASAFADSSDLRAAAASPLISPEDKSRALSAVAAKLGLSELGRNLVGVVAKNGRAAALPEIGRAYFRRLAAYRGTRRVEIVSAQPLAEGEQASILAALEKALGAKVQAELKVDDALIGGFVVRAGSRQFDASVKSKLDQLKLALKSA